MPEKTNENIEQKEKKKVSKKLETAEVKADEKTIDKKTTKLAKTTAKATNMPKKTTKPVTTTKKTAKSLANVVVEEKKSKLLDITKKAIVKKETKEKIDKKNHEAKEENVIEKIKNFISKIIAMQEEARLEAENKKTTTSKAKTIRPILENSNLLEYYDLPYRYNETIVKILAQTPKRLFVYWDISDKDREKYLRTFGETFFEDTYPVLLVHNKDKNYTFEVLINDFANSWYLDINDSKSKYVIELGRKFKTKPEIVNIATSNIKEEMSVVLKNDYVPIVSSNVLEVPNDHILFENIPLKVLYRNVKNNTETYVNVKKKEYKKEIKEIKEIHNIFELYKELYKEEFDKKGSFEILNPSSMSSSKF